MRPNQIKKIAFLILFMLNLMSVSFAADRIVWEASSGVVKGYRLYYSTVSGNYSSNNAIDVGLTTECALSRLPLSDSTIYYIVVRAYNDIGESQNSNVIVWQSNDNTPPIPPSGIVAQ